MLRSLLHRAALLSSSEPIPRAPGVSDRSVHLALGARFADELMGGLPHVLMPTLRSALGLSLAQVGLLRLVLDGVAAVVEPVNGLLLDRWPRRRTMAFGAACLSAALAVMGLSTGFWLMAAGFALYGLGTGPLAHTGDVVLIEAHPEAPERIFTRSNLLDTVGALLAPLLIVGVLFLGGSWRMLLLAVAAAGLLYAAAIRATTFPAPSGESGVGTDTRLGPALLGQVVDVARHSEARRWLAVLFALSLWDAAWVFSTVWMAEVAGMSQRTVGLYHAMSLAVTLVAVAVLERRLATTGPRRMLLAALLGLAVVVPAWLWAPGIVWRFVLGVPLAFLAAWPWPIARGRALASVPGRAGTVVAVQGLFGVVPVAWGLGALAETVGLTAAMGGAMMTALATMAALTWWGGRVGPA